MPFERRYISSPKAWLTFLRFCENVWLTFIRIPPKVGLGVGSFPIGMPFFWPSATLPNLLLPEWSNMVFLKFNNATFSATTYPKLAQIFPSLVLPDARGDFPRIWDDGRGVDSGRSLLTEQGDAIRNISGFFDVIYGQVGGNRTGPFFNSNIPAQRYYTTLNGSGVDSYISMGFDAGRVVPVANENRPVNIAFNLLVRAA
ncbi:phage tail protein [Kluyvera ascorbata]|uniref:phage tail protein n=1 Tax=Kluyvera ascorbata TaxID=51288 RepID=UPI00289A81E1|nr:phage tail protein [Kluyvera ascorbata]